MKRRFDIDNEPDDLMRDIKLKLEIRSNLCAFPPITKHDLDSIVKAISWQVKRQITFSLRTASIAFVDETGMFDMHALDINGHRHRVCYILHRWQILQRQQCAAITGFWDKQDFIEGFNEHVSVICTYIQRKWNELHPKFRGKWAFGVFEIKMK